MEKKEYELERCPTGIDGLDELICGGFPRGRTILVSGSCGTGKTIFATQFLYNGALKYNEPGILVTLEQNPLYLRKDMKALGMDLEKLEAARKVIIIDASLSRKGASEFLVTRNAIPSASFSLLPEEFTIESLTDIITQVAENVGVKRVAIDSLPALDVMIKDDRSVRNIILNMNYRLQENGLTSIIISDILTSDATTLSRHGIEEYIADGVITLYYDTTHPNDPRSLVINKLRGTSHSENIHPIRFVQGKGMEVMPV